jgi:beta-glucosidase
MIRRLLLASCSLVFVTAAHAADDADARAAKAVSQMTVDEKISLVHGIMAIPFFPGMVIPPEATPGAGYFPGVARVGVPAIRESDASLGVAYINGLRHDGATALPSSLATAATWNPEMAYQGGAVAGQEAWRIGFNVLLGGGVDLARDPRNGRNFEYLGEDPLLAGTLAGEAIRGTQDQHVVSTIKHYAINDEETGRQYLNAKIGDAAARESDLLAFEIAIERGHPGSVMCSYNQVNGVYACENDWLLNGVLKHDWGYRGWVMSDWGAVHSVGAALNGLDQESGEQIDAHVFFNKPLLAKVQSDPAYARRLDDMNHRIVRSLYAAGAIDNPPQKTPVDIAAGKAAARKVEEQGIVLLRNEGGLLPLLAAAKSIAVIGGHADMGVISGGGSSQVAPPGGPALIAVLGGEGALPSMLKTMYMPSSPLLAVRAETAAAVSFDNGAYPSRAAAAAARADVAIVFATQWMTEAYDAPDLSLPEGQDALIEAVAAANPHTIVVLETGGPVLMPWLNKVGAVLEAWYPGIGGGEAIADVLFGKVDPSGHLPLTFPASLDQTPRPTLPGADLPQGTHFDVDYAEGSDVGYRWFAKTGAKPLFPFGFGLSYTRFAYSGLTITRGASPKISFTVQNTGAVAGADVPQVYLLAEPHRAQQRLIGFSRVALNPGESRTVEIGVDPRLLADWDEAGHHWRVDAGDYKIAVGASASDLSLNGTLKAAAATLKP